MLAYYKMHVYVLFTVYKEFERLLQEQAPLEAYMEWLDIMVNTCVVQVSKTIDSL